MRVPHEVPILTCFKVLSGMSFNLGFYVAMFGIFSEFIKSIKNVYYNEEVLVRFDKHFIIFSENFQATLTHLHIR